MTGAPRAVLLGAVVIALVDVTIAAAQAPPPLVPAPANGALYRIQPGDVLDLKFFYNPELDETLPVRPDGRISAALVNDVQAAGLTPSELREQLLRLYGVTLRQPELSVIVKEFAARRIYVGGEVNAPSLLRVEGRLSLLQAIFEAGGLKRSGKATDVVVLRYQGTTEPEFLKVDLTAALERGDPAGDVPLQAFDIVWVPKTKIAKANDFMDQYFRQLVPIPLTMGISYVFGGFIQ
jgi:protein involved in polysaccharide export with SLBB domain